MMRKALSFIFALTFAFTLLADSGAQPSGPLTKVEPRTVCMINEHAMGKEQIAVEVDGKTYYGCCEMCKKALASDAAKRVAVDPVSGKQVDKSKAVIAAQQDGRVFYFESDATLDQYNASVRK